MSQRAPYAGERDTLPISTNHLLRSAAVVTSVANGITTVRNMNRFMGAHSAGARRFSAGTSLDRD